MARKRLVLPMTGAGKSRGESKAVRKAIKKAQERTNDGKPLIDPHAGLVKKLQKPSQIDVARFAKLSVKPYGKLTPEERAFVAKMSEALWKDISRNR